MSRLRIEYRSEPKKGEPFLMAEGSIEVMYNSELVEMKEKLRALGIRYEDMKVSIIERIYN